MKRRTFLQQTGLGVFASNSIRELMKQVEMASRSVPSSSIPSEMKAEVVIIGGGTGGCAAALAAARTGRRVIMTEESDWIGGQLTAQAVPPDEHPWIESFGATRAYRDFRTRVREYYRRNYPLTTEARAAWSFNPGNGFVSSLCHEPRVALAVLYEILAPYVSGGHLTILLNHKVERADTVRDTVRAVTLRNLRNGRQVTLTAPFSWMLRNSAISCPSPKPNTSRERNRGLRQVNRMRLRRRSRETCKPSPAASRWITSKEKIIPSKNRMSMNSGETLCPN